MGLWVEVHMADKLRSSPAQGPAARGRSDGGGTGLWRNVVLISLTAAFATSWYLFWSPVMPLLLGRVGATGTDIALIFAVLNITSALAQYFGGRLADRFGVRLVIGWTGIALGVTWLAMALVTRAWAGLGLFFVLGNILFGVQMTAFITVVSDSVAVAQRTAAFSYYQFWSAVSLIAGPVLGAFLILPHLSPPAYLALTGAAYLTVGFVRLFGLREPRPTMPSAHARFSPARFVAASFGTGERRRLMVLTSGVTLAFALTANGPFLALATHGLDHVPIRYVDLLFGIGAVGALAASLWAARLARPLEALRRALLLLALASAALAVPLGTLWLVAAYLAVFAGFQVATVTFSTLRVAWAGDRETGEVLGATSAVAGLVAFLGVLLAGALGSRLALVLGAAVSVGTALWAQGAARRRRPAALGGAGPLLLSSPGRVRHGQGRTDGAAGAGARGEAPSGEA